MKMKKALSILLSVLLLFPLMIVVDAAEVTIDGNFDDSIWTDIPWIHVNSASGYWQTPLAVDETRDQNYDVKFRADEENLYIAVKTNFAPVGTDLDTENEKGYGNGNGTNFRLWTFVEGNTVDGEPYTKWNYLVDYAYKPAGNVIVYKGSSEGALDAETAGIEGAGVTGTDSWAFELKIPFTAISATDSVSVYTTLSSPLVPAEGEEIDKSTNNALYYPSYGDHQLTGNADAPYMTWNTLDDLDIVFDNIKVGNEFVDYLPYKSIKIDNYGDFVASEMTILTRIGENSTIGEVSSTTTGELKDYYYFYMVSVGADGIVTETNNTFGAKDAVVIPDGGYVLLVHDTKDADVKSVFTTIEVGDQITLHNVDLDALAAGNAKADLPYSAFTFTKAGEGVVNNSDKTAVSISDTGLLTDGDKVSDAGDWPATGVQLIQNLDPTNGDVNPNVDLTLNLGEVKAVDKVELNFYHCYNVMIGLPKGNRVVLSYSEDGKTFERLGNYAINGEAAAGTFGTVETVIDIPDVTAQYINLSFDIGPSPFGSEEPKVVWEFVSMTEFSVVELDPGVVYGEEAPDTTGDANNVALNKPWSGIDYHPNVSDYTGDFTDGVIDVDGFSYPDPVFFAFYRNGAAGNIDTNLYGEVIIDLGEDGTDLGGVRMQVAPSVGTASSIKVYASNNGIAWDEVGELTYDGTAIQWMDCTFANTLDAQYIKVGVQCDGMFFMVSEIEVIKYTEPVQDESEPETSEPETSEPETSEEASEPETSEEESVAESATESGTAGGESEDASTAESEAPGTGDSTTALYIAIALVMMGASVVIIRRRRA